MSFELEETVDGRTDKTAVGATALIDSSPENLPPDGGGKPHLRVVK
jgi:hypothetical protein